MKRSCVPKWIKKGEGKVPIGQAGLNAPMNFKHAEARKSRPASNKGRGHIGGWAAIKELRGK